MYKLENMDKKTILFVSFITACYPHVSAIAFAKMPQDDVVRGILAYENSQKEQDNIKVE